MYKLPYYHEEDEEIVKQFVRDHPFAFIAGSDAESNPVATQVPLFIDERDGKFFLTGHIMRNTDHHKAFVENENVLAIFTGPHSYVSATWYDNPYQASTWNFMSVHAIGPCIMKIIIPVQQLYLITCRLNIQADSLKRLLLLK